MNRQAITQRYGLSARRACCTATEHITEEISEVELDAALPEALLELREVEAAERIALRTCTATHGPLSQRL